MALAEGLHGSTDVKDIPASSAASLDSRLAATKAAEDRHLSKRETLNVAEEVGSPMEPRSAGVEETSHWEENGSQAKSAVLGAQSKQRSILRKYASNET